MNLVWALLITLAVAGTAIGVMLLVRRRAPEGSYFADGDRASGVFGVIATGFSVLLGFIVFLAFTSYDRTKSGAETEALMVGAADRRPRSSSPRRVRATLTGQLVCYGRFVVHDEWPRMRAGTIGNDINPWGVAMFKTLRTVEARTVERAVGVRPVARADDAARGGAERSRARRPRA